MQITQIIRRPVLTEKSNTLQQSNVYTFEVDWKANKFQIKQAIEFIFQVKVINVNTLKMDKKPKNLGKFHGFENRYKKAIVTLKEGDVIHFYPNEAEAQDNAKKEVKASKLKEEKTKASEKEAQLAKKIAAKKAQRKTSKKSTDDKKAATNTKKTTTKKVVNKNNKKED